MSVSRDIFYKSWNAPTRHVALQFNHPTLLPPVPVVYSPSGTEWTKDYKKASYLSLFQNSGLNPSLVPKQANSKFPNRIPYDYSWPSTKNSLTSRVCGHCGMYFGSIKSMQKHLSYCRTKKESRTVAKSFETRKVRPQKVEARRQKELLCAMAFQKRAWRHAKGSYMKTWWSVTRGNRWF